MDGDRRKMCAANSFQPKWTPRIVTIAIVEAHR